MKNTIKGICKVAVPLAIIYGGICMVLGLFQRSLIYFPNSEVNSAVEFIELDCGDATIRVSVNSSRTQQAVIYFGGNAEDVSLSLRELTSVFPDAAIYAMHYRGYGGSTGKPTEAALHSDAQALYERVRQDHKEIVVVGRSLGSGVATALSAENDVYRLILVTPFDSLVNVAKYHYPFLPVGLLMVDRYESYLCAPKVQAPTLVFIAETDRIVPRSCTLKLIESFKGGNCWSLVMPGTDHNSLSLPEKIIQQFINNPSSLPRSTRNDN